MFGNAYLNELANQMPKYGAINLFKERRGDSLAKVYLPPLTHRLIFSTF